MTAIPFDKQLHKAQFADWCRAHKMPVDEATMLDVLPDSGGYIVEGLGCVFLYLTQSKLAYVDMMMTNPLAPFAERREAGRILIDAIIEHARANGVELVSWCTSNRAINHYAQHAGAFQIDSSPHQVWYWKP